MAVNESRRTLAGYPLFYGEPGEDADLFVADFKMALRINHIRDPVESLGLFEVTLRKSANTWFTALTPPLNQDFEQVLIAFHAQFGQAQNPQKLWKEILLIRQRTLDDYLTYRQAFNAACTIWLQSLPNPGDGVEFLKKEQFTARLIPTLRLKVESGDPVTYHDAERRAYQKYRKLKCLEEEPLPVLRPREVPIQVSNIAPIPVVPMVAGPSTQPAMIDNEVLERLQISYQFVNSSCTRGHGINNCPYPRGGYGQPPQQLPYPRNHANDPPPREPVTILQRPNLPLAPIREDAPIPPLPDPGVHVVEVASVRPPAYAEALANGIKRTRGNEKEDTMREDSIPSGREYKREKGETSKRRRRRCINLHDFPLGHGMSPYNLIEDLQEKGPSISWPQFFALCPQVRREMAKAISTRIPKKKGNVVRIAPIEMEDIVPTIDCFIKSTLVRKGLVDGGAQICIMIEATMHRLNLKIHKTPEVRVKMADNSKAKCLGMVRDVRVDALGVKQELDFYIMSSKGNGYPLILGHPWLIKMGAKQDWEIGELICERAGKKIVYDMKEKRHEEVSHESTTSESKEDLEDTTSSSEDLSSSLEEGSSVIDVMGIRISHCFALQRAEPRSEPRAALLQQDPIGSRMRPVYFASRVLLNVEKRYSEVEQAMLALMFANSKWMMELQEYEYTFKVEDSARAQLADLLTYRAHEKKIEIPKVKVPPPPPKVIPNAYTLSFDGAFRRGVGKAGGGLVLLDPEGKVDMEETLVLTDSMSNNEVEFDILILGLKACISRGIKRLMVKGDALLVVKQVMGVWACKSEKLKGKVRVIRSLLSQFSDVQLYHIPRKENQQANDLAQRAVKEIITLATASLKPPRFEGLEALAPIVSYILEGEFPPGLTSLQRKRLIKRARWSLVLKRKGSSMPKSTLLQGNPSNFEKLA
ncbi:hypothetical protein L7F22_045184 [Adiantum nelumboides]|nr:hypothetical protein [Adiantum nelumboides]